MQEYLDEKLESCTRRAILYKVSDIPMRWNFVCRHLEYCRHTFGSFCCGNFICALHCTFRNMWRTYHLQGCNLVAALKVKLMRVGPTKWQLKN
jgi:hypothetical protein